MGGKVREKREPKPPPIEYICIFQEKYSHLNVFGVTLKENFTITV